MARRKKNKASIGCLFWIALILLVLVIFLFNRETIQNVLEETGFMEIIQNNDEPSEPPEPEVERTLTEEEPEEKPVREERPIEVEVETKPEPETVIELEVETEAAIPEKTNTEPPKKDKNVRRSKMYFIEVGPEGNIKLKGIVRPVYYIDSPLTETMKTLLEGLSSTELNMGLISLIPEQTRILSISLKNNTAYLNFSDEFRFNSFGVEGYNAQLKQVVYTATEFSNVKSVQILIEGAKIDYMGPEGVFIGKPLSRSDF